MAFPNSHLIEYYIYNGGPSNYQDHHQVLEIQRYFIHRLMLRSPFQIINQTSPIPLDDHNNALFPLPLYLLHDHEPISFPIYVAQLFSTHNIDFNAFEIIGLEIALLVHRITNENPDASFHITVIIDFVQLTWMESLLFSAKQPTKKEVRMERLEEIEKDSEECSICLEKFCSSKREVVKIPCGHVFHESCILKWLGNSHSCPLCRSLVLPLED